MVTVQQVFDTAIHLMDEQNESNGGTQTVDTDEYRFRTISIGKMNRKKPLPPVCASRIWRR